MAADLLIVLEAVEKNTAAISKVANALDASSKRMESAFKRVEKAQRDTGNGTKTLAEKFRQLAIGAIRNLGASLLGLAKRGFDSVINAMVEATQTAISFEKAIAEVATLADRGAITNAELAESVKGVAAQYGGELNTQARALYQAISAGAETGAESIKVLETANKLAIGGVTDQATAIDGLTSVLNAYGLDMEAFSDVVSQKFFTAMRKGKTTVGELSANIGVLAPTAKAAGISLDEMFGAVAAITKGGIRTETAVISFNQALVAMLKPSKKATDEAERLGIQFNAAALRARGFKGVMDDITAAGGNNSASMTKLFGNVRALRAVLALTNNDGEIFADTLQAMENNVTDADDAMSIMSQTMAHQIDLMDAAGESASESFGAMVAGSDLAKDSVKALTVVFQGLDGAFTKMKDGGFLNTLVAQFKLIAGNAPLISNALQPLISLFDTLLIFNKEDNTTQNTIETIRKSLSRSAEGTQGYIATLEQLGVSEKRINEILQEGIRIRKARDEQFANDEFGPDSSDFFRKQEEAAEEAAKSATKAYKRWFKPAPVMGDKAFGPELPPDMDPKNIERRNKTLLRLDEEYQKAKAKQREADDKNAAQLEAEKFDRQQDADKKQADAAREFASTASSTIVSLFDIALSESENKAAAVANIFKRLALQLASNLLFKFIFSAIAGPGAATAGGFLAGLFSKGGIVGAPDMSKGVVKMDRGGILQGGTEGRDSIPVLAKQGEEFLTRQDRRIVSKALESRGGHTINISPIVRVEGVPPSPQDWYKAASLHIGPAIAEGIKDGTIKLG